LDRATFLALLAATPVASGASPFAQADRLAGGGLGFVAFDRTSGRRWELRAEKRFRMASVFKLPLAAYVWDQVDRGQLGRGSAIPVRESDLRAGPGSTEANTSVPPLVLAGRAIRESDNTAADVLLRTIGGPQAVTAWLRRGGFDIRLDRTEADFARVPAVAPSAGDVRDTTSPNAMALFLDMLVHGNIVGPEATASIMAEMESSATGHSRLRARLPQGWTAGDKTGTDAVVTNDVGFLMAPNSRGPLVVAAFVEAPEARLASSEAALAAVGRTLAENLLP
jgi:beta-lactamase class A